MRPKLVSSGFEKSLTTAVVDAGRIATTSSERNAGMVTGVIYSVGLYTYGLPELLVQDVPEARKTVVVQLLHRLMRVMLEDERTDTDIRSLSAIPSDSCIVEMNLYFRAMEVTNESYRRNLIRHIMRDLALVLYSSSSPASVAESHCFPRVLALLPWYVDTMESWAALPPPPEGQHERRDKICAAARIDQDDVHCITPPLSCQVNLAPRGQALLNDSSPEEAYSMGLPPWKESRGGPDRTVPVMDAGDAYYFAQHYKYFTRLMVDTTKHNQPFERISIPSSGGFLYHSAQDHLLERQRHHESFLQRLPKQFRQQVTKAVKERTNSCHIRKIPHRGVPRERLRPTDDTATIVSETHQDATKKAPQRVYSLSNQKADDRWSRRRSPPAPAPSTTIITFPPPPTVGTTAPCLSAPRLSPLSSRRRRRRRLRRHPTIGVGILQEDCISTTNTTNTNTTNTNTTNMDGSSPTSNTSSSSEDYRMVVPEESPTTTVVMW